MISFGFAKPLLTGFFISHAMWAIVLPNNLSSSSWGGDAGTWWCAGSSFCTLLKSSLEHCKMIWSLGDDKFASFSLWSLLLLYHLTLFVVIGARQVINFSLFNIRIGLVGLTKWAQKFQTLVKSPSWNRHFTFTRTTRLWVAYLPFYPFENMFSNVLMMF